MHNKGLLAAFAAVLLQTSAMASEQSGATIKIADNGLLNYNTGKSALWLQQTGLTNAILDQANGGKSFVIGLIDTGVLSGSTEIGSHISSLSSCASLTFSCTSVLDDNGHGTATAAIAAGYNVIGKKGMSGVAPNATILEEKALNKSGIATDLDIANGIMRAVDAGAGAINLSVTYVSTPTMVRAINYAASQGVYIVFAGGNSATALNNGINTTGLSLAALDHLMFVGSVNASNVLSTFSNTPGSGSAITSDGFSAGYASMWLMAPGENIYAPTKKTGKYANWSGTSMSAPMVTGALALLINTWPVLGHDGTAAAVLLNTATDLGDPGVDSVYGWGLLNLARAFQPVGSLQVVTASGQTVPVTTMSSTTVSGGTLSTMSVHAGKYLSNYTVFDAFQRNFTADLSPLLNVVKERGPSEYQLVGPRVHANSASFANGAHAFFATSDGNLDNRLELTDPHMLNSAQSESAERTGAWAMSFSSTDGTTVATGHGFSANAFFTEALWGSDSGPGDAAQEVGHPGELLGFASGGDMAAVGTAIDNDTRVAIAWSSTASDRDQSLSFLSPTPRSQAGSVAVSHDLGHGWRIAANVQYLQERNGLLGEGYSGGSLTLGPSNKTISTGLTASVAISSKTELFAEMAMARTGGASLNGGMFQQMSPVYARSFGAGMVEHDLFEKGDAGTLSVSKPLSVFAGSIALLTASVDADGLPVTTLKQIGLAPDASETDVSFGYSAQFSADASLRLAAGAQFNSGDIRGRTAGMGRVELHLAL